MSHEREIVFFFFFCGKQPIKNKPYFYKSFSLTRDNFSLTLFFVFCLYYQILKNVENYFYRRSYSETNRALD